MDNKIVTTAIKELIKYYIAEKIPHTIIVKYTDNWLPINFTGADYLQISMKGSYFNSSTIDADGNLFLSLPKGELTYEAYISDEDISSVTTDKYSSIHKNSTHVTGAQVLAGTLNRCIKLYNVGD